MQIPVVVEGESFEEGAGRQWGNEATFGFFNIGFENLDKLFELIWILYCIDNELLEDMLDNLQQILMIGFYKEVLIIEPDYILLYLLDGIFGAELFGLPFMV